MKIQQQTQNLPPVKTEEIAFKSCGKKVISSVVNKKDAFAKQSPNKLGLLGSAKYITLLLLCKIGNYRNKLFAEQIVDCFAEHWTQRLAELSKRKRI